MNILAIDPGTHCGWAFCSGGLVTSGCWDLRPRRHEGGGMRFLRLRSHLSLFADAANRPDLVVYEEVRRHVATDAAHIYGGIVAVISAWCEELAIPYEGIPVGTIKKLATGKGNADKAAMIETARSKWPDQEIRDDNQADALWIMQVAIRDYGHLTSARGTASTQLPETARLRDVDPNPALRPQERPATIIQGGAPGGGEDALAADLPSTPGLVPREASPGLFDDLPEHPR